MKRFSHKRTVDMQVLLDWIEPRSRVLDLGCGRGVLLEHLVQSKQVYGIGIDLDFGKVAACIQRGLNAYQGDMLRFMRTFPEHHFDYVILSRTLEEVAHPAEVIEQALRVSRRVTVGFVNHAFWRNRFDALLRGRKPRNAVYTTEWFESRPTNPVSIADFEHFCQTKRINVVRRAHLRGDWKSTSAFWPNLLAGYALYDLEREASSNAC